MNLMEKNLIIYQPLLKINLILNQFIKHFLGGSLSTRGIRNLKDLPDNAKRYIHALEDFIGARISSISTSPERDDTILVEDPFNN